MNSFNTTNNVSLWNDYFFDQLENDLKKLKKELLEEDQETSTVSYFSTNYNTNKANLKRFNKLKENKKDVLEEDGNKVFSLACLEDSAGFQKRLKAYNEKVVAFAQKLFDKELPQLQEQDAVCLAMTGSDGRQEKLCLLAAPIEVVLVVNKESDLDHDLIDNVKQVVAKYNGVFHPKLETKCLEHENLMKFDLNHDLNDPDYRVFPTRALDAMYLTGSNKLMTTYQKQFFDELKHKDFNKLMKKFSNEVLNKSLEFENVMSDKPNPHLNFDDGTLNYDGDRVMATKYPFLRPLQYAVATKFCRLMNQGKLSFDDFLKMPRGTVEKIQFLADRKLLKMKNEDVQNLKKAYLASLVWVEQAQRSYVMKKNEPTRVSSKEELLEVARVVCNLANKILE